MTHRLGSHWSLVGGLAFCLLLVGACGSSSASERDETPASTVAPPGALELGSRYLEDPHPPPCDEASEGAEGECNVGTVELLPSGEADILFPGSDTSITGRYVVDGNRVLVDGRAMFRIEEGGDVLVEIRDGIRFRVERAGATHEEPPEPSRFGFRLGADAVEGGLSFERFSATWDAHHESLAACGAGATPANSRGRSSLAFTIAVSGEVERASLSPYRGAALAETARQCLLNEVRGLHFEAAESPTRVHVPVDVTR